MCPFLRATHNNGLSKCTQDYFAVVDQASCPPKSNVNVNIKIKPSGIFICILAQYQDIIRKVTPPRVANFDWARSSVDRATDF